MNNRKQNYIKIILTRWYIVLLIVLICTFIWTISLYSYDIVEDLQEHSINCERIGRENTETTLYLVQKCYNTNWSWHQAPTWINTIIIDKKTMKRKRINKFLPYSELY